MKDSSYWSGLLIPACLLLMVVTFVAHVGYLSRTGFVTGDDQWLDLCAAYDRTQGPGEYVNQAFGNAQRQGRVSYFVSWSWFLAPYFVDSELERALLTAAIQFLSWVCLAWFLAWYTSKTDAWVLVGLICCLLPYVRGYWPIGAVLIAYTMAILLFFFGLGLYLRIRAGRFSKWRRTGLAAALAALFLSLFVYENLDLAFVLIAAMSLWHAAAEPGKRGVRTRLAAVLRRDWAVFALYAGFAVIYVAFRIAYPGTYDGTKVSWSSLTKFGAAWNVIWRFTLLGMPGVNFFVRQEALPLFWVDNPRLSEVVPFLLGNLSLAGFLKAGLGALVLYWFGSGWRARRGAADYPGRADAAIPVAAVVLAFLLPLPLAITPKYQAVAVEWAPYITGYFSFLCLMVAGWAGVRLLARALARANPRAVRAAFAGLAMCLMLGATLNSVASEGVARKEEQHYAKWRLMNAWFKTAAFREVPDGAVVVAPTLWEGVERNWWTGKDRYWSDYIALHTGRKMRLLAEMPSDAADLMSGGRLYCAEVQGTYDGGSWLLLVSRITASEAGKVSDGYLSNRVEVVGYRDYKELAMTVLSTDRGRDSAPILGGTVEIGPLVHVRLPAFKMEHGAYATRLARPGMVAGSWRLISDKFRPIERPRFEIVFRQGFSYVETDTAHHWNWSDGPTGTGVIDLVNDTGSPLEARFETGVRTGSGGLTAVDVDVQGRTETVRLRPGERLERVLTLAPGSNEIRLHSHGTRIEAPGDPRYIVFGLEDWSLSLDPAAGKR